MDTVLRVSDRSEKAGMSMVDAVSSTPDPEVLEKKKARYFTARYKIRILAEVDACKSPGEIGAILRREGLYHSNLKTWRRQRDQGILGGLTPKKRGRKPAEPNPLAGQVARLERENKWSWDITRLKGPSRWTYFQLYVIMDIFSRYVVGWMVAHREHSVLARQLIEDSCCKQEIRPDQLTLHADRGSSMRSKVVSELLCDLKVVKTHSRPHVSNDNPYSESQFKTLKYCPDFPERFGSIEDARIFCRHFFDWYNRKHRHSGIGFLTPEQVHYGLTDKIISRREAVLMAAFNENSRRFRGRVPHVARPPARVWINPPSDIAETPAPEGSGQGCPDFSDTQSWMTDAIASHHKSCAALH